MTRYCKVDFWFNDYNRRQKLQNYETALISAKPKKHEKFTNLAEDNLGEGSGDVCAKVELETIASVEEVGKRRARGDAFSVWTSLEACPVKYGNIS